MNPTPAGWPRFSSAVFRQDAAAAICRLCTAFGFDITLEVRGARIVGEPDPEDHVWRIVQRLRGPATA